MLPELEVGSPFILPCIGLLRMLHLVPPCFYVYMFNHLQLTNVICLLLSLLFLLLVVFLGCFQAMLKASGAEVTSHILTMCPDIRCKTTDIPGSGDEEKYKHPTAYHVEIMSINSFYDVFFKGHSLASGILHVTLLL